MNTFYSPVKCIYHRFRHTNNEFSVALRALGESGVIPDGIRCDRITLYRL